MKKLNRAVASTLGLGLLSGLVFSFGCSSTPSPDGGGAGGAGATPGTGGTGQGTGGTGQGTGGTGGGTGGIIGTGGTDIGTGGSVTTEGEPIPKPPLITTADGDFWNTTGTITPGGTAATITVDSAAPLQNWIGWGGTFNERGWKALTALDQAKRDEVMSKLFSKVDGAGITWGRIPIGASDYAMERYTLCDAPCDETNIETSFSIARDLDETQGLIPFVKAAQAVVTAEKAVYKGISDTIFWGSPWTPPPWMKTGALANGYDKGVMRNEPAILEAYAKYFVLFVQKYGEQGIPINHVYPQNEPGWAQAYPSCAWGPYTDGSTNNNATPAFLGTFVENNLVPALTAAGLSTTVWYGTFSNGGNTDSGNNAFPGYWADRPDASMVSGVGLQWAAQYRTNTVLTDYANKPIMQTEHQCGNYPWLSGANNGMTSTAASAEAADKNSFWAEYAPNNYNYGIESWELLKQWITGGVNGYSAWNMVLDRDGKNLDVARPWPQNALISFEANGDVKYTPYYYVFRHLSQYVEGGGKRITVTGGDALAFQNPDGSIVTVIYNSGAATQLTVSIDGTLMQFQAPANGWATINTPAP
jgi:glucosylceramidase